MAYRSGASLMLDDGWYRGVQRGEKFEPFQRAMNLRELQIQARFTSELSQPNLITPVWRRVASRCGLFKAGPAPTLVLNEKSLKFDPILLAKVKNVRLAGYWQSERYFSDIRDVLIAELQPRDMLCRSRAAQIVLGSRNAGNRVVGVHVRRGDIAYAHEQLRDAASVGLELLPLDYYERAMRSFGTSAQFVICSDDPAWCERNLAKASHNRRVANGGSLLDDFETLRQCDDIIIANSTFSWWAAWLNERGDKRVICPLRWYTKDFPLEYSLDDLLPAAWERIAW